MIGRGTRLFRHSQRFDKFGVLVQSDSSDVVVFNRALGVNAIEGIGRDLLGAEEVSLGARLGGGRGSKSGGNGNFVRDGRSVYSAGGEGGDVRIAERGASRVLQRRRGQRRSRGRGRGGGGKGGRREWVPWRRRRYRRRSWRDPVHGLRRSSAWRRRYGALQAFCNLHRQPAHPERRGPSHRRGLHDPEQPSDCRTFFLGFGRERECLSHPACSEDRRCSYLSAEARSGHCATDEKECL
mmetsp:Transcript_36493/g.90993  ORF Transcript_36493/g.90993 Transcript_36493/m.90993 type:complete len:239 (+) Transcript_36493:1316-2032(+)